MGSNVLPTDPAERKGIPVMSGVLDYFPAALAEVARVSKAGNDQHNPGQPLHWARGKSTDQADTLLRHLMERGTIDSDGMRHSAKVAWRALALLQTELEEEGLAPLARGARLPESTAVPVGQPLMVRVEQDASLGRLATEGVGMTKPRFEHDGPQPNLALATLIKRHATHIAGGLVAATTANLRLLDEEGYEYNRAGDVWLLR